MSPGNMCHRGTNFLTEKYVGPTFRFGIGRWGSTLSCRGISPERTFLSDKSLGKGIPSDKSLGKAPKYRWGLWSKKAGSIGSVQKSGSVKKMPRYA
ncbi:hypothetical protein Tco_0133926 [Tanacetum coccineum]